MKKEELNFADPQFKKTMIPGKVQRWIRNCVLIQFISMTIFGLKAIGIIMLNIGNERDIPQS